MVTSGLSREYVWGTLWLEFKVYGFKIQTYFRNPISFIFTLFTEYSTTSICVLSGMGEASECHLMFPSQKFFNKLLIQEVDDKENIVLLYSGNCLLLTNSRAV